MGIDVLSFVLGKAVSGGNGNGGAVLENLPISLDFTNGNQTITAPDGYLVKSATIEKPSDLIAENIREGKNIAGVVGTMEMPEIVENVPIELDFSNGKQEQKVAAPDGYAVKSIKIQKPVDLKPENIAEGVEIAGVVGTHVGGGGTVEGVCYVTFMSGDGTTELYKRGVISGNNCGDVVELGLIDTPTKASTNAQTFEYNGWSLTAGGSASTAAALKNVTEDRTVYAAFKASARMYTVRFFDGDTLLNTMQVEYGATADYTPAEKDGYFFDKWEPSNSNIVGDTDCYAQWETIPDFATSPWSVISAISEAGNASDYFAVGDTRRVQVKRDGGYAQTITFEIVGFDHDNKAAGGKAGISVLSKTTTTQITHGDATFTVPTADETISELLFGALPSDLQAVIKPVVKKCNISSVMKYPVDTADLTLKVWRPCIEEVGASGNDFYTSLSASQKRQMWAAGLGTTYAKFASSQIGAQSKRWLTRNSWNESASTTAKKYLGNTVNQVGKFADRSASSYEYFIFGFCV